MPLKKVYQYEASLTNFPSKKILINIKNLNAGDYEIHIIYKNKTLKTFFFTKES